MMDTVGHFIDGRHVVDISRTQAVYDPALGGFNLSLLKRRQRTLGMSLTDLFPGAGDLAETNFWTGLRPMTPDGTPIIGSTPVSNLYLNTGHGTLGWTMACGSGQVLADLMSGRSPRIRADDLGLARYNHEGDPRRPLATALNAR